jgi:hypothetical protein
MFQRLRYAPRCGSGVKGKTIEPNLSRRSTLSSKASQPFGIVSDFVNIDKMF